MASDMVVALGAATVNGHTLFGHNSHRPAAECQRLVRLPGRVFAQGEVVQTQHLQLPQVRQTWTVLASQPAGCWGFQHGLNEHRFAAGCSSWSSRLPCPRPGLLGTDLVRLMLERCRTARQAVDLLTDLIVRHGQSVFTGNEPTAEGDHLFLIADPAEAFAVEAAGDTWAIQQVHAVRAASAVGVIRQDWGRICPGLADRLSALGWWQCDGNKLDFVGSLGVEPLSQAAALRRWGRATFLLEEQSGRMDAHFLRGLLADHANGTHDASGLAGTAPAPLCRHGSTATEVATSASLVADLGRDELALPVAWCAFGPPCTSVYFPVFLDAELPAAFNAVDDGSELWRAHQELRAFVAANPENSYPIRATVGRVQARIDQEVEEFASEAASLQREGRREELLRLAGILMQSHVEQFQDAVQALLPASRRLAVANVGTGSA